MKEQSAGLHWMSLQQLTQWCFWSPVASRRTKASSWWRSWPAWPESRWPTLQSFRKYLFLSDVYQSVCVVRFQSEPMNHHCTLLVKVSCSENSSKPNVFECLSRPAALIMNKESIGGRLNVWIGIKRSEMKTGGRMIMFLKSSTEKIEKRASKLIGQLYFEPQKHIESQPVTLIVPLTGLSFCLLAEWNKLLGL